MAQLKMYRPAELPLDEPELPAGYSFSHYKDENDKMAWVLCCRKGLVGDDADEKTFDDRITFHDDTLPERDVIFIDHLGEHVGTVTAIAHHKEGIGEVHMVGIREDYRGRGLAGPLNAAAVKKLQADGVRYMELTTDEWRKAAVRSYLKAGFLPVQYDHAMVDRWQTTLADIGWTDEVLMINEDLTPYRYLRARPVYKNIITPEGESNALFKAIGLEDAPMYDCAVITDEGTRTWKYHSCNSINNSHSVTKLFIAAGIGSLCDEGEIDLDEPVTFFFTRTELPADTDPGWRNVTIRDALRHMTGLESACAVDDDDSNTVLGDDFLSRVFRIRLPHRPGTYRQYSDAAYYLLSRIIAAASGMKADDYLNEFFFRPMGFGQWTMVCCPEGHPIGGGGLFARALDVAKLGKLYADGGVWEGKRLLSEEWIELSKKNDFALTRFRDTDIFVKTGSRGQMIAFSSKHRAAAAWHGCADPDDEGRRNDRLLCAFAEMIGE